MNSAAPDFTYGNSSRQEIHRSPPKFSWPLLVADVQEADVSNRLTRSKNRQLVKLRTAKDPSLGMVRQKELLG